MKVIRPFPLSAMASNTLCDENLLAGLVNRGPRHAWDEKHQRQDNETLPMPIRQSSIAEL